MILVVGATGSLGGRIARSLLDEGQQVRILLRPRRDATELVNRGAEVVTGDLKDRDSLDAAVLGVDTVVTTATAAQRGGDDTIKSVDERGNQNLIDAAAAAGVRQFVFVSALGAHPSSPAPLLVAKGKTEERLRASGVQHTILQPDFFIDIWLGRLLIGMPLAQGRPIVLVGEGRRKHSMIAEDDVRKFAQAAIGHAAAGNQTLVLGGPEPLSFQDVIATYERVLGRPLEVQYLPPGSPVPGLPDAVASLPAALDTYDSPIPMDETAKTFGVRLTSLEEFVRKNVPTGVPTLTVSRVTFELLAFAR